MSGAGPLLHRATLLTARRYSPGVLPTPASAGAVPVEICRLSGLRAAHGCPHMTEWFAPGTEPADSCDWHRADGSVVLPQEYAAWLERRERDDAAADGILLAANRVSVARGEALASPSAGFRIVSPSDGDRYQVPPGVDPRFSTIALRAAGARDPASVRWSVDGRLHRESRLPLTPGEHVIRAFTSRGDSAEVRIVVE